MKYYNKYLKYKLKYNNYLKLHGGNISSLIDTFISNYTDIILEIYNTNKDSLKKDDFPSTSSIINDYTKLDENTIKSIYSKTCHVVGIIFIQYLINNNIINIIPDIKIKASESYSYIYLQKIIDDDDLYTSITNFITDNKIKDNEYRSIYIKKILSSDKIEKNIKHELIILDQNEKENNLKALEFIKKNNTISRICINRDSYHEFIIIHINNNIYLLETNMYDVRAHKINKIKLSIEDIENIFNNNINQELYDKIYFKINKIDGFFIQAFYGYNIKI